VTLVILPDGQVAEARYARPATVRYAAGCARGHEVAPRFALCNFNPLRLPAISSSQSDGFDGKTHVEAIRITLYRAIG
jgi:hypothetical protein